MKLLPLIDDRPKPHDHPKPLWWFEVSHPKHDTRTILARNHAAARYAVSKIDNSRLNAIYYSPSYKAKKVRKPYDR
jgi:hypothetical protein